MAMMSPIELNIYDPETNEVKKPLKRAYIPWGVLKKALRLSKSVNLEEPTEEDLDQIALFIVSVFGADQVSLEEIDAGCDSGEMVAVLQAVMSRAAMFVQGRKSENPPPAAG